MSHDILYRDMSPETGFSPKGLLPKNDFSPKDGVPPETSTETFVLDLDVYQMIQIH